MKYFVTGSSGREYAVTIIEGEGGSCTLEVDGSTLSCDLSEVAHNHLYSLILDHRSHDVTIESVDDSVEISMDGRNYDFRVLDEIQKRLEASGGGRKKRAAKPLIKADMPGVVVSVAAVAGKTVSKGDVLLVVEAMKMQNEITAPADADVVEVPASEGQVLAAGDPLVKLKYRE